ncbi:MAG: prepilin-type N-terminal cleavage/methylation domain-containing protein [Desulfobacteraceae bacterium]|nr:prepilin-type N-terminal cleavage/methylation domain-containing protein [Desulfobacteraceae bacterium]
MIINREKGFTLIEIAIVMVIIGLLMGGGVSIFRVLNERKTRNNTIDYLKEVKEALITYADINGKLPNADTNGDGLPDGTSTVGTIPYVTIGVQPKDSWSRDLKYEVNASLYTDRTISCSALRSGLSGNPLIVDADAGAGTGAFSVAAVIVSAGPMDADSSGDVFDDVTTGSFTGNNTSGNPNYIRNPPTQAAGDEFDDLATYIGANELYRNICEYLVLAVNNNSASTVYVYNQTQGSDIGSIAAGGTSPPYNILSGTRIEIRDTANGGGSIVSPTTPPTPITLSGQGCRIDIPDEYLDLRVFNNSASKVYVFNATQGSDILTITGGNNGSYDIDIGTLIEIRSKPNGTGKIVSSITTLFGDSCTITIP